MKNIRPRSDQVVEIDFVEYGEISRIQATYSSFLSLLSKEELDRFKRFHFDLDRWRFAKRRVAVRQILGSKTNVDPGKLEFSYNEYGKPFLSTSLAFSVSTSGNHFALAASMMGPIGVDLEAIVAKSKVEDVASAVLSPEELRSLEFKRYGGNEFFWLWSEKEAIVKAIGKGLSLDPRGFCAPEMLEGSGTISFHGNWRIVRVPALKAYACSLCVPDVGRTVVIKERKHKSTELF